jgi:hypothetical protein
MTELVTIFCEGSMVAVTRLMKNPTDKIKGKVDKIKSEHPDWSSDMVPILRNVIKERLPKFLDDMKDVVNDPMFGKELILRENLNAECILTGIEVINRMTE